MTSGRSSIGAECHLKISKTCPPFLYSGKAGQRSDCAEGHETHRQIWLIWQNQIAIRLRKPQHHGYEKISFLNNIDNINNTNNMDNGAAAYF
jgi:hypothetical protein